MYKTPRRFNVSRRAFLTGAGAAFSVLPRRVLGGNVQISPGSKTTLACIGVGGQGLQNMLSFLEFSEIQVVAVCDVCREGNDYLSWNWSKGKAGHMAGPRTRAAGCGRLLCQAADVRTLQRLPCVRGLPRIAGEGRRGRRDARFWQTALYETRPADTPPVPAILIMGGRALWEGPSRAHYKRKRLAFAGS